MARGLLTLGRRESVSINDIQEHIFPFYHSWANPNPGQIAKIGHYVIRNRPFDIGKTTREIFRDSEIKNVSEILKLTAQKNEWASKEFGNGMWSNGALV